MRSLRSFITSLVLLVAGPAVALGAVHNVTVQNFSFVPQDITVQQGDTIQWNWASGTHTVTNGTNPSATGAGTLFDAPMDSDNIVFSWNVTVEPGVLDYHCGPHWFAGMTGTITVEPAAPTAARYEVIVRDFEFDPDLIGIASGDTVCWIWESGSHTTTSGSSSDPQHNPGALWSSPINSTTTEFCYVFDSPGLYNYFCIPHESLGMNGAVAVDEPTTGLPPDDPDAGARLLAPFPNPSTKVHNMRLVLEHEALVRMEVFDLQGRRVYSAPDRALPAGNSMLRWSGETRSGETAGPGMYLVRVRAGEQTLLAKVFRAATSPSHHH